jgi:zinc/manganese transport system substrate-binding protein
MSIAFTTSFCRRWFTGLALALGLCTVATAQQGTPPLRVVASFSILADWVREVGGPAVEVHSLVPAGADAHVFSPSPADAQRIARAELVVVNGLRYEGWLDRLVKAAAYRGPVLVATQGIVPRKTTRGSDPHAWQSLANARIYVENIRNALVQARPGETEAIQRRATDYLARLEALERQTQSRLGALPPDRRRVITGHDAFGYFADAYGLRFFSPRGWTTGSEPSADSVARLIRQAREQQASALLVENLTDPRLIERIAREAGVRVGGHLYADALTPPGGEADTFLKLFSHNVDTLVSALGPAAAPAAAKP